MALTSERITPFRDGVDFSDPVAAGAVIYVGALVALDAAGNLVPGTTATGLKARGVAMESVDNSAGAAGDQNCQVRAGVARFGNDGTITRADLGATAYIVDDETVADNDATGTRSAAGVIVDVDADGVWVKIGL